MTDAERKSPKEWTELLSLENRAITLEEYRAGIDSRVLGAVTDMTLALRHLETMVGAMDDFLTKSYPGLYAGSGEIRKALAEQRAREMKALVENMEDDRGEE